jgi:hypothetical protein
MKVIKNPGIPHARTRIDAIIHRLQHDATYGRKAIVADLIEVKEMMFRKPPIRRAKVKARRITEEQVRLVIELAERHPNMHQHEIGHRVGLNAGRVSEILNGLRA